ncbi:uncharacterized protein LOC120495048 [Tachysurus ichikawai]
MTSIQKGDVEGFSGCLEHTGVLSQLIQEAKEKKGSLTVYNKVAASGQGVLAVLADILEQERRKKQPAKIRPLLSTIAFVKEGQRPVLHSQAKQNFLQSAKGWEIEVDLGRKLHFPEAVLATTLRPNIIMWSPEGRKIIMVELIMVVPWEEGSQSVWNLLRKVGLRGHLRKAAVRKLGEAAERASCWLWHKREDTSWKLGGEGQ